MESLAGPAAARRGEAALGLAPASQLHCGSGLDHGTSAAGCSRQEARGAWLAGRSACGYPRALRLTGWRPGRAAGALLPLRIVHLGLPDNLDIWGALLPP
ncbi:hypothetical protein NDU88_002083 [Pleurodeles waltl]|uniref:Uncharacterized protein n=1 Tax=Pleurodeles waltl TaxID=8319 RepID=A0AAV7SDB0_PLEWA|nr:hypothetical protein NDU88_002083 [Pleurodeles waltl]